MRYKSKRNRSVVLVCYYIQEYWLHGFFGPGVEKCCNGNRICIITSA